jgi:hypothetical protein
MWVLRIADRIIMTVACAAFYVATPMPIDYAAFALWIILLLGWTLPRRGERGRVASWSELVCHLAIMIAIVQWAIHAPVKTVDRLMAQHIVLPRQSLELYELEELSLTIPGGKPHICTSGPDDLAKRVVDFPARDLTVAQLIATIESQTPYRHQFGHCGNGRTILWGGDCSFGLRFYRYAAEDNVHP